MARRAWTRYWLVDPLDGTREFVKKNGEFSVNIALIEEGAAVFGVSKTTGGNGILHALDCWTLGTSARDGAWPLGISPGLDPRISDDPLSVGSGVLADHRVERSA